MINMFFLWKVSKNFKIFNYIMYNVNNLFYEF